FGVVYMAEQEKPVRRKVALKIIKLGMDTKQVIARFEAERQALAMMDHPNIAKVLDAGATDTGRPYFVMELVRGVPVTEYCDTENLNTHSRLELFMQICHAVQHAHTKGIIHRDIKPSNVMITLHDGAPVPKVIDFGIAKAIHQRLTDKTLFTEYNQFIGTPEYMSPEQAEMSGLDIDTRSDIYSLGVLLYELLTGTTPFDGRRLRSAGIEELQRIIREEEPDKPSTRLSSLQSEPSRRASGSGSGLPEPEILQQRERGLRTKEAPSSMDRLAIDRAWRSDASSVQDIARHRRTDPRSLAKQLRGDLDWVVMKCLEKERARRYETANGLAADLQRHLSDEPVEASPPSARYRFRKFARRNKRLLGSITAIAAALVIGLTLATYGFITASNERDQKVAALTKEQQARAESEAVTDFLSDMLAAMEPEKEGKDVTVRAVLDKASKDIAEKFADQPLIEARLRGTIGRAYLSLGHYTEAEPHARAAMEICRRLLGKEHPDTLQSMGNLAIVYAQQGRYDEAEPLYVKTLEIRKRVLGEEHPNTLTSMNNLAMVYESQGRYAEAEPLQIQTLEIQKRVLGEEHPGTLGSMNSLAFLYYRQGRYDEAEAAYLDALEIQKRVLGDEHPETLASLANLSGLYHSQGRFQEAETLGLEVLAIRNRVLGDEHPQTMNSMNTLAIVYAEQGRYEKAEALFRRTLEFARRVLGDDHPHTLASISNLAILYSDQGRYSDAEPLMMQTLEISKRVLGEEHPSTLASMHSLAFLYFRQGRYAEAEPLMMQTLEISKRVLGEEHPSTLGSMHSLANLYRSQGRYSDAEPLMMQTLEVRRRLLGDEHPDTLGSMENLALLYIDQGRYAEAEALHLKTLEIRKRVLGEEHPSTLSSMGNLASLYNKQGRYDEAEPLFVKTLELRRRVLGEEHPDTMQSSANLLTVLVAQGKLDEARPLLAAKLDRLRRAAEQPEAGAKALNNYAWELLTIEPAGLRDPEAALELARRANDLTDHDNALYLDTLALAYHMTGDTARALETQEEALSLLTEDQESNRPEMEANLAKYKAALEQGAEDD
ncbi:MAG: tetratricopeptide repeat protein, partial [Planctomycetes bacterium]|nr:tetratricopeptide repeat protein [Planctomycetota bacterium]